MTKSEGTRNSSLVLFYSEMLYKCEKEFSVKEREKEKNKTVFAFSLRAFYLHLFFSFRTELNFTVAIDFTKSNLPSENLSSLHYTDKAKISQYEIAIQAIAEICQYYNKSHIFHAYGFGAKLPHYEHVQYNFPLVIFFF